MPVAINGGGGGRPKKDPLDIINSSLQIANGLAMLPKAYGDIRTSLANANSAEIQSQSNQQLAQGQISPYAAATGKIVPITPVQGPNGTQLLPPGAVTATDPTGQKSYWLPENLYGQYQQRQGDLRKEFAQTPELTVLRQANANMQNVMDAAKSKTNEGDQSLLLNAMKVLNPNVQKAGDGNSLVNADGLPDQMIKAWNKISGNNNIVMGDTERKNIFNLAANSYKGAAQRYAQFMDNQKQIGAQSGYTPEQVGLLDLSSNMLDKIDAYYGKKKGAPDQGASMTPKAPNANPGSSGGGQKFVGQTVMQNGHTYQWNPTTKNYE